jgi:hypothetical protein
MFNKPNVFNRNDPVTRRDVQPSVGSSAQPASHRPQARRRVPAGIVRRFTQSPSRRCLPTR